MALDALIIRDARIRFEVQRKGAENAKTRGRGPQTSYRRQPKEQRSDVETVTCQDLPYTFFVILTASMSVIITSMRDCAKNRGSDIPAGIHAVEQAISLEANVGHNRRAGVL